MLKKFLKEAMVLIAGKPAEDLVDLLDTNKHVNEFAIAKKLNLTINQTRNILYKISDHGLVSSIRKKDKRKGWYTYFWKIEILKSLEFIRNDLMKKRDNFEHQIKSRETKRFYVCEKCHIELNEEHALLNNFTCLECESLLTMKDNTKIINEMKRNLDRLKKDLGFVQEEVKKESEILDKKKQKEIKKEKKETLEKKTAQRAKNAKNPSQKRPKETQIR
jgi:transcription factor E